MTRNSMPRFGFAALLLTIGGWPIAALAGDTTPQAATTTSPADKTPNSFVFYFDPGSSTVRAQDVPLLDQATRVFREGKPIVMVVTANADSVGAPEANLHLSEARANAVERALVNRGVPAAHFQLLAKGQTELPIETPDGTAEPRNRRAEITWR